MADFKVAFEKLKELEGGYVNNALDSGGETFVGISRKWNPGWSGWTNIDAVKQDFPNLTELNKYLGNDIIISKEVESFYKTGYWKFDSLQRNDIATKTFLICVNFGFGKGISILQRAISSLGVHITIDGVFGPNTLAAIEQLNPDRLLRQLTVEAVLAHVDIVLRNPHQQTFLRGWVQRDV